MKNVANNSIESRIHSVRGEKVILDADLAAIYGVTAKRLNETVRRNRGRFPPDFCFQLAPSEWEILRSQIATSKSKGSGGRRYLPWVFTEHGAIMVANVLRSDEAVQMSVFVVRAFIRMRNVLTDTSALAAKLDKLEREVTARLDSHEGAIVELMRQFLTIINPENENAEDGETPKREIGFHVKDKGQGAGVQSKRVR
ncbi:MAG TPA: ORF6N domain-containing protein [Verrucomicrobiae bacterium]